MRIPRWPLAAIAIVAVAACSSSAKTASPAATTTPTTTPPTTTAAPATAAACRPAAGYTPGTTEHNITVDGKPREFLVHLPPHPTGRMRLIVNLHGAGSNMRQQEVYSGMDAAADKYGFAVAYPNGLPGAIRQWHFASADDLDFSPAVVRTLVRDACVDAAHAYAVGISSGGAMTAALACRASDTFAGFGPVAGDFYGAAFCGRARQRPMIIFHGTADPLVPYYGGHVINSGGVPVQPEETTAALWARHNGCTSGPTSTRLASQVTRLTWNGCVAPVVLYRIEGGGHTWPGSAIPVPRLGPTTEQVSATDEMLKFFAAH